MHSAVRQELPASVASSVNPLEPYDKFALIRITGFVSRSVPPIGNCNVSVKLNLDRVQLAEQVRGFPE
jgi:hypothetical protein